MHNQTNVNIFPPRLYRYNTDLMVEVEVEAQDMTEGDAITHVGLQQADKERLALTVRLKALQHDVQHAVGVQVEAAWREQRITVTISDNPCVGFNMLQLY